MSSRAAHAGKVGPHDETDLHRYGLAAVLNATVDWSGRGEAMVAAATSVREGLLQPLIDYLAVPTRPLTSGVMGAALWHGRPTRVEGVVLMRPHGARMTEQRLLDDHWWATAIERLGNGDLRRFTLAVEADVEVGGRNQPAYLGEFTLDLLQQERSGRMTNEMSLSVPGHCLGGWQGGWQAATVDLLCQAGIGLGATTGFANMDFLGLGSSLERYLGLQTHYLADQLWRVRGYHWANLLSDEHVRALGGWQHALDAAPCVIRRVLEGPDGPLLYLQLTDDIESVSEEQLRALRAFLLPVLPQHHESNDRELWYVRWPLVEPDRYW